MKVVLIHPPHENSKDDRLDPPLGLLYIASNLRKSNIDVQVMDLSGQSSAEWKIPYADYYGITVYITSLGVTRKIVNSCKEINPDCKIVVGGAHPSACPNDFPNVDHVVVGYGEVSMQEIIKFTHTNHVVIGKECSNFFEFPAYDLVDIHSYHRRIGGKVSLPYLTSRGCPCHCAFCGLESMHQLLGYKVRFADADVVISHIRRIKEEFGITSINFQDDIFTLKPERLFKILEFLKQENISFRCMGKAGYDRKEVYEKLAECGCEAIAWGIESGSQHILDRMRKKVKVEDNHNVIRWAKECGITSRAFFIIGFPGETEETLEETKQFILEADPDQYFCSTFVPYPLTDVYNHPEKYGVINISDDYSQYYQVSKDGTGGVTMDTKWLSKEQFRELELEFRNWLKENKPFRGEMQNYEREQKRERESQHCHSNDDSILCQHLHSIHY